jgi:hypothetical protein
MRQGSRRGCELGNHTFSHMSLHEQFSGRNISDLTRRNRHQRDIESDTETAVALYSTSNVFVDGLSLETKARCYARFFVHPARYTIERQCTIDNADWIFASANDKSFDKEG